MSLFKTISRNLSIPSIIVPDISNLIHSIRLESIETAIYLECIHDFTLDFIAHHKLSFHYDCNEDLRLHDAH